MNTLEAPLHVERGWGEAFLKLSNIKLCSHPIVAAVTQKNKTILNPNFQLLNVRNELIGKNWNVFFQIT